MSSQFHTGDWWEDTLALLSVDFVQNALLAALLLGIVSGAIAPLIVMRKMSFAAHSTGELALMGAANVAGPGGGLAQVSPEDVVAWAPDVVVALDPAFAPGTGTPEIGGFTTREALHLLRGLRGLDLVGADVVEVAPSLDPAGITALAGAGIAFEILCLLAEGVAARQPAA